MCENEMKNFMKKACSCKFSRRGHTQKKDFIESKKIICLNDFL